MAVAKINGLAVASVKKINWTAIASCKKRNWIDLAVAVTYATWNPSDKINCTLSNGNLTWTKTSTSAYWNAVRSTIGKSSGKRYREIVAWWTWTYITITGISLLSYDISNANVNNYPWSRADGWLSNGYWGNNWQKVSNASFQNYWNSFAVGDVIWVALDMDNWEIKYYKNNVVQNSWTAAYTWLSWTWYAISSVTDTTQTFTANFWATAMDYSPPSGYNAWLYS